MVACGVVLGCAWSISPSNGMSILENKYQQPRAPQLSGRRTSYYFLLHLGLDGFGFGLCTTSAFTPPAISSIHCASSSSEPSSSNLRAKRPTRPAVPSSSNAAARGLPVFHAGLFVVSRVSRASERGDVVQCVYAEPSARITFIGNLGTSGFGSVGARRFQTCVRPYGELETARLVLGVCWNRLGEGRRMHRGRASDEESMMVIAEGGGS